jgi:hypothetical protein
MKHRYIVLKEHSSPTAKKVLYEVITRPMINAHDAEVFLNITKKKFPKKEVLIVKIISNE